MPEDFNFILMSANFQITWQSFSLSIYYVYVLNACENVGKSSAPPTGSALAR